VTLPRSQVTHDATDAPAVEQHDSNAQDLGAVLAPILRSFAAMAVTAAPAKRFTVEEDGRIRFIGALEIQSVVACRNNVVLHTASEVFVLRSTLQRVQEELSGLPFLRVERSILLNMSQVVELQRAPNRKFRFRCVNGRWHVSGASYFDDVIAYLHRCEALVDVPGQRLRRDRLATRTRGTVAGERNGPADVPATRTT